MSNPHALSLFGVALALLSPALFAQEQEAPSANVAFEVSQELARWTAEHGPSWQSRTDLQTGYSQLIFGGSVPAAFEPENDGDFADLGLHAIAQTTKLHGIEVATLSHQRTLHLPLGLIGSSDKFTVRFVQAVNGVPVLGGYVNTLFTPGGELLSVQSSAMPGVASMSTDAVLNAERAVKLALASFEDSKGLPGTLVGSPLKAIGQLDLGLKQREAVLVWEIDIQWHGQDMEPEGTTFWIDARNGGIVRERTSIHNVDVGGTLSTMATPGVAPDQNNNPPVPFPLNRARVTAQGVGTVMTDVNGNFNFPGLSGPINLTLEYFGDWCDSRNDVGADHMEVFSANGTSNNYTMNTGTGALITSQSSTYQAVSAMRDWIRSVNPSDNTGDFRAVANNNLTSTCNAFFNGSSINLYQAGGGCNATSYSTVVVHEMGHWYNVKYGTGNGPDGMGEGNSDVFSLYIYNTPHLGLDFFGQGSGALRSGNNLRQFCGDSNPGCYGGVHADGEPWMGAAWKVFLKIEAAFGTAQADMVTDAIFLGWMNAYNQTTIRSIIEEQWLILDDDDANIANGTPHYAEIDAGFRQQGFPGFDLPQIDITNVTELGTQNSELGPYTVDATVDSLIGNTITGTDLHYSVNGGAFNTIPMSSTGTNTWSAGIPGQISPAVVRYYVEATDSATNTEVSPEDAPAQTLSFVIGVETVFFFEDFEGGQAGWTHNTFGDTSNSQDDWQFGTPGGQSGDPGSASSGINAWGNDLSIGNFNGAYQGNVHNWLRSPGIDLSTAVGSRLRLKRWLTVEEAIYDQARIAINGVTVWTNPLSGHLLDTSWVDHEVDISALADGNSNVVIEFSLQTDGGLHFGGWTLDDVEIVTLDPVSGSCIPPVNYGQGKLNSVFSYPTIAVNGLPSEAAGSFDFDLNGLVPNAFGIVFSSAAAASVPMFGGTRLVAFPVQREGNFTADAFGYAIVPQPVAPGSSGTKRYYQAWYRDGAHSDGTGVGLTDAVEVQFCD